MDPDMPAKRASGGGPFDTRTVRPEPVEGERCAAQGRLRASWVLWIAIFITVALVAPATVCAQDLEARAQAIAAQLRCPVCQNESVADSPAELAAQMRALIREQLAAGASDEQIVAYFVSRYGEWILLDPPRRGVFWIVWAAPAAALLAGLLIAGSYVRRTLKR